MPDNNNANSKKEQEVTFELNFAQKQAKKDIPYDIKMMQGNKQEVSAPIPIFTNNNEKKEGE